MERNDAFREPAPARARLLLDAATHRHEHPGDFLPQQIEQELKILAMIEASIAETRSNLTQRINDRKPRAPAIDFLRRELVLREKNLDSQRRKTNRLAANLIACLCSPEEIDSTRLTLADAE